MSSTGPGSAMSMSMTTSHRKRHRDLLPEEIMSLKGSGIVVSDGSFSDRIDLGEEEEDPDPDSNVSSGGESEEEIAAPEIAAPEMSEGEESYQASRKERRQQNALRKAISEAEELQQMHDELKMNIVYHDLSILKSDIKLTQSDRGRWKKLGKPETNFFCQNCCAKLVYVKKRNGENFVFVLRTYIPHSCVQRDTKRAAPFPVAPKELVVYLKYSVAKDPRQCVPLISNWLEGI